MGLFKKNGVSPLHYEDFEYYTISTIIYNDEKMKLTETLNSRKEEPSILLFGSSDIWSDAIVIQ